MIQYRFKSLRLFLILKNRHQKVLVMTIDDIIGKFADKNNAIMLHIINVL